MVVLGHEGGKLTETESLVLRGSLFSLSLSHIIVHRQNNACSGTESSKGDSYPIFVRCVKMVKESFPEKEMID